MKLFSKIVVTAVLMLAFVMLSGFRAQTIIHDDGSETQDVLKVSDTRDGQKQLKSDADSFQQRNYTVMDYDNGNGSGFRAMRTITKESSDQSSVDRVVHKTYDGIFCSTYYIDYTYNSNSLKSLRLGIPMDENDSELEYVISFPSGTRVVSNSSKPDDQGSTYLWGLNQSGNNKIRLTATVWHKLWIYVALFIVIAIVLFVLYMEHRRKNVISWNQAASMRRMEILLLLVPIAIFGYMGYEYYVGTHITDASLAKVTQQQQQELKESKEEDQKIQEEAGKRKRDSETAALRLKNRAVEISNSLRDLSRGYQSGSYSRSSARSEAQRLASQAKDMLNEMDGLTAEDRDAVKQLINRLVDQSEDIGSTPPPTVKKTDKADTKKQDTSKKTTDTGNSDKTADKGNTKTTR